LNAYKVEIKTEEEKMKNKPVFRTIAILVALVFICYGSVLFWEGYHIIKNFPGWLTVKLIDIDVDLSKKHVYSGEFKQVCQIAHGEYLYLSVPEGKCDFDSLNKLRYRFVVTDANDKKIINQECEEFNFDKGNIKAPVLLSSYRSFAKGDCKYQLIVTEPVLEFANIPQHVILKYHLCGLELLMGKALVVFAFILYFSAFVLIEIVIIVTRRKRKRANNTVI